ncbi:MAG: hypothetical protein QCI82_10980 [Candidatus Thermoplasmatota archaeon]|nr:hypothetical protein [Candidatus Thermoplasmatota archaeon]
MKVAVENIVVQQRIKGEIDPPDVQRVVKGCRYQPEVFKGLIYEMSSPNCEIFLLPAGMIRVHGVTSIHLADKAVDGFIGILRSNGFAVAKQGGLDILNVTASHDMVCKMDPSKILSEFKEERIDYDPSKLPGFSLRIPSTGIEILIFPEGKIISTGAATLEDSVSSLEMVRARLSSACIFSEDGGKKGE